MDKVYSYTKALCPKCGKVVTARIIERGEKIYLEKLCQDDGISFALICSDAEWYKESMLYVKPPQSPRDISIKEFKGCPDSCGLCPEHQQHTCLPVIEITSRCNMNCPICLKHWKKSFDISLLEYERILMRLSECEQDISVINLSGGEPTCHPDFEKILQLSVKKNVMQTTVSTNGLRLLHDTNLRKVFKETNTIVALQFDGFKPETYLFLRGEDISNQKLKLIEILENEEIKYSLVATLVKNVNNQEITSIVNYFFKSKALSLMFQPATFTGKAVSLYNDNRMTIPDVVKEIEKSPYVKKGDFNPLPCSHFSCFALAYYFIIEEDNFLNLKEFLGKEKYLEIITNRTLPGLEKNNYSLIKEKIYEFWATADSSNTNENILKRIRSIMKKLNDLDFAPKEAFNFGSELIKAIFIHQFMDKYTLDFSRLIKCCTHYPQIDNRLIPMCAQNVFFQHDI